MPTDASHLTLAQMEDMRVGARTAVRTCMGTGPSDRVFIFTDVITHGIGKILCEEASDTGAQVLLHDLEQYSARPIEALPEPLRADLASFRPTVTFFAASAQPGEVAFRTGLRVFLLNDLNVRHAHMVGITRQLMLEGMRSDYAAVASATRAVYDIARLASEIRATTEDGTDLVATLDPALRWVPCTGIYRRPGMWGNLPEGETFTCPKSVNGRLAAYVVGDYFSERYGVLKDPLIVEIRDAWAASIQCADQALAAELTAYLDSAENGRRVGEFAIGTNVGLKGLVGNLLQDEKLPGIHIAFGRPYPEETGATWSSPVHVDLVPVRCTVSVDGDVIMRDGRLDFEMLGLPIPRE
jgi:aminopeptidase